jgi:hypothetical protein
MLRFSWRLMKPDGSLMTDGTDFGMLDNRGRLTRIVGFFGPLPTLPTDDGRAHRSDRHPSGCRELAGLSGGPTRDAARARVAEARERTSYQGASEMRFKASVSYESDTLPFETVQFDFDAGTLKSAASSATREARGR